MAHADRAAFNEKLPSKHELEMATEELGTKKQHVGHFK